MCIRDRSRTRNPGPARRPAPNARGAAFVLPGKLRPHPLLHGCLLYTSGWGLDILGALAERYDGSFESAAEGDQWVASLIVRCR